MTWETASLLGVAIGFCAAVALMADRADTRGGFAIAALTLAALHAGASLGWRLVVVDEPSIVVVRIEGPDPSSTVRARRQKAITDRIKPALPAPVAPPSITNERRPSP